ncbi:hypothetical protein FDECE_9177 [Fusarium decemcellulare]|nr:hypothetical protein FDECE_9177 [Fusarium decemcellulare]
MEEPTETPSPKLATVEDLPPELFDHILAKLPRKSLSSIRLVWPRLDPLVLPRLFSTFHFAMRRRDIERFCKIASSPHLSHCVQQVQWYELRVHWEREINELEKRFYAALDAMPNLHTFVTEFVPDVKVVGAQQHLDPADSTTSRQYKPRYYEYADFEGYLWEPGPAMLRPESRITTIKCLNLGDLPARWFKPLWDTAHMPKLEGSVTPRHYPDIISTDSQLCADFKLYIWKDDVQNILDAGHFPLCRHSDRHDCQHSQLNQVMDLVLRHPAD